MQQSARIDRLAGYPPASAGLTLRPGPGTLLRWPRPGARPPAGREAPFRTEPDRREPFAVGPQQTAGRCPTLFVTRRRHTPGGWTQAISWRFWQHQLRMITEAPDLLSCQNVSLAMKPVLRPEPLPRPFLLQKLFAEDIHEGGQPGRFAFGLQLTCTSVRSIRWGRANRRRTPSTRADMDSMAARPASNRSWDRSAQSGQIVVPCRRSRSNCSPAWKPTCGCPV